MMDKFFDNFTLDALRYAARQLELDVTSMSKQQLIEALVNEIPKAKETGCESPESPSSASQSTEQILSQALAAVTGVISRPTQQLPKFSAQTIDPHSEGKLVDQAFKRRRQRGMHCFRTPYGEVSSRSAPASPSHGGLSGLVTPDCLSREPSPIPDNSECNSAGQSNSSMSSSSITSASHLDIKTSKSAPGSPGAAHPSITASQLMPPLSSKNKPVTSSSSMVTNGVLSNGPHKEGNKHESDKQYGHTVHSSKSEAFLYSQKLQVSSADQSRSSLHAQPTVIVQAPPSTLASYPTTMVTAVSPASSYTSSMSSSSVITQGSQPNNFGSVAFVTPSLHGSVPVSLAQAAEIASPRSALSSGLHASNHGGSVAKRSYYSRNEAMESSNGREEVSRNEDNDNDWFKKPNTEETATEKGTS